MDITEHQSLEEVDQDLGVHAIFSQLIQQIGVLAGYWLNVFQFHRFFEVCFPLEAEVLFTSTESRKVVRA